MRTYVQAINMSSGLLTREVCPWPLSVFMSLLWPSSTKDNDVSAGSLLP